MGGSVELPPLLVCLSVVGWRPLTEADVVVLVNLGNEEDDEVEVVHLVRNGREQLSAGAGHDALDDLIRQRVVVVLDQIVRVDVAIVVLVQLPELAV